MDISKVKPTGRTIEITHPATGEPLGVRVGILSIDDDKLRSIKRAITDESLSLQAKNKHMKVDQLERNADRLLFAATTDWEWYSPTGKKADEAKFNGEVPEYNQKNFIAVCKELPWFADQIRDEVDETKAFFETSKTD